VRNGNLERAEDVFDLTVNEVTALLRSGLIAPADPALRARTRREARAEADARVAPLTVGPPTDGSLAAPDLSGFPDDLVRGTNAMVWYTTKILGAPPSVDPAKAGSSEVTGQAVSPGTYEGTARRARRASSSHRAGGMLVCPITSPVWSMVFPRAHSCAAQACLRPRSSRESSASPAVSARRRRARPDSMVRVDSAKGCDSGGPRLGRCRVARRGIEPAA
jgi:pyruvate,water dikinase